MTHITQITVEIKTGDATAADADGPVYLGVGSREFRLAKKGNSFERANTDTFILGNGAAGAPNVNNPDDNDPLKSITDIQMSDILGNPSGNVTPVPNQTKPYDVYIRYESNNKWLVESVKVRLIGEFPTSSPAFNNEFRVHGLAPPGIWLGSDYGKYLYLQVFP